MPMGAGKYDNETTEIRESIDALGVILLVIEGERGSGFSVQAPPQVCVSLPGMLRDIANQIESSLMDMKGEDNEERKNDSEDPGSDPE